MRQDDRVVFNICGNKYRLVVKFRYPVRVGLVCFIGTHAEYDKIDVEKIKWKSSRSKPKKRMQRRSKK